MSKQDLGLGQKITTPQTRDAIHIAVLPVVCGDRYLSPGMHVGLNSQGHASRLHKSTHLGIVDPYLRDNVKQGETFWLFLYPNTITSLAHHWTHPGVPYTLSVLTSPRSDQTTIALNWLRGVAKEMNMPFTRFVDALSAYDESGEYTQDNNEMYKGENLDSNVWILTWAHYHSLCGNHFPETRGYEHDANSPPFTCSC